MNNLEQDLLKNSQYLKARERKSRDVAFRVGRMISEARIIKGKSQEELANIIGTKQPAIARLENGKTLPSLRLLLKIADAFETFLIPPKFHFMNDIENMWDSFGNTKVASTMYFKVNNSEVNNNALMPRFNLSCEASKSHSTKILCPKMM